MTKRNLFKRTLAVFISVLMIATSLPVTALTAFADDETIVWKFDPSQTSETGNGSSFNKGAAYKVVDPSNNNSFIQGIYWNETEKNCNTSNSGYIHAEDASISGGIGSTTGFGTQKLYGNHWIFQYRYAYLAQGKNGSGTDVTDNNSCSVFALGNNGANVINITSDGNVYLNGSATATTNIDRTKFICTDKADVRTAAFEYDNGTLTFSVKGEPLFTTSAVTGNPDITNFFMGASTVVTAGGTMQYVGPTNTGNLIHGMYLYKLIGSIITESESSALVKTGTLSPQKYTLITGSGSRLSSGNWNIVNDQEAGNTSAGIVKYDIKDLKGKTARDSTLNVQITTAPLDDYQGLTFYWTTDSSKVEGLLNDGEQQGKISGSGSYGSGVNANQKVANTLGFSVDNNKLVSLPQSSKAANTFNLNIPASTMQKIIDTNSDVVYIVCMQSQAGGSGSTGGWTDTIVSPTSVKLNYVYEIPDAPKSDVVTALNAIGNPTVKSGDTTEAQDDSYKKNSLVGGDEMLQVLYTYGVSGSSAFKDCGDSNYCSMGTQWGDITLLWDGSSKMACPVNYFHHRTKATWPNNKDGNPQSVYMRARDLSDNSAAYLSHAWHGGDTSVTYQTGTTYTLNTVNSNTELNPNKPNDNTNRYYSNTIYIDGSKLVFGDNYRITVPIYYKTWYYGNGSNKSREVSDDAHSSIRVINYAPLADIIRGIKNQTLTEYMNIKGDAGYYTGATSINYLNALKEICDFDPNDYFGKSTNNYSDCCTEIARLLKNYNDAKDDLKLNTYTVTFRYHSGNELVKKVKRFGTVTCPNDDSPSVTSKFNADQHTITRYYWGPADPSITEDKVYNELSAVSYYDHDWVEDSRTPATCTEDGSVVSHCSVCDYTKTETLTKLGHAWNLESGTANYETDTQYDSSASYTHKVTCKNDASHKNDVACSFPAEWTVDGDIERKECSVCHGTVTQPHIVGHTITFKNVDGTDIDIITTIDGDIPNAPNLSQFNKVDADGHHSFSWDKALAPATEDTTYTLVENDVVPHSYSGDYTQTKAPTCSAEGEESRDCTVDADCTFKDTRPVEKLPHTFGDWIFNSAINKHHHICSVCDEDEYGDCSFTETVVKKPTCTEEGETLWTCTECGGSYKSYPPATGHDDPATLPITGAYDPTCTESGYTGDKVCTKCNAVLVSGTYTDPLGHDYIAEYTKGTCQSIGTVAYTCSRGDVETTPITMEAHELNTINPDALQYISWHVSGHANNITEYVDSNTKVANYKYTVDIGVPIDHIDISFTTHINDAYVGTYDHFKFFDASGNEIYTQTARGEKNNTVHTITIPGNKYTLQGLHMKDNDAMTVTSIVVYPAVPDGQTQADYDIQEHNHQFRDNGDGATHTDYCLMSYSDGTTQEVIHNASVAHDFTGESVHTDADGDNNGYTEYYCSSGCGAIGGRVYDTTDWTAYDAAKVEADANKADTKRYTSESIADYSKEVAKYTDGVTSGDVTKSQAYINAMTSGIGNAVELLKVASYTVTFNVQYNSETIKTIEYTVPYATVKQFEYTAEDGKYISKWTAEDEKDDKRRESTIATGSDTASHAIYSDTTITVYLADAETKPQDTYSVTLIDKNDKVIDIATVATTDNVVINKNGNELLFNENVAMTVPKYPYYQVTGFINADTSKSVVGETVNGDIRIKAVYSAISNIVITSDQDVTINETDSAPYTAFFDEKIVAYAENATAWYVDGKIVAYGDTYTFQASASVKLSYTTETVSTSDANSRIDFAQYDADVKAFRIVVSNCVPEGAEIVKQGVKILTSSSTIANVTSAKVIAGTKDYVATKTTGTGNQFMYTIGVNDNINTMAIVSYVTYIKDGQEKTVWSSEGDTVATMVRK